jgi:hypothetical protein
LLVNLTTPVPHEHIRSLCLHLPLHLMSQYLESSEEPFYFCFDTRFV